jgi:hypothetical protein
MSGPIPQLKARVANKQYNLRYRCKVRLSRVFQSAEGRRRIVDAFNSRNIVLTVTAGRSGSETLCRILEPLRGVTALHEPQPQYRYVLEKANCDANFAGDFFRFVKAPAILSLSQNSYVETSHLFCKAFLEPSLALGFRPSFIFLRRDIRQNALSLLKKNAVPGRTPAGRQYLISSKDNVYVRLNQPESLSDYQLCFWYCLEIEYRQRLYEKVFLELALDFIWLRTDDLNSRSKILELIKHLTLDIDESDLELVLNVIGKRYNASRANLEIDQDLDKLEEVVFDRIEYTSSVDDVFNRFEQVRKSLGTI